MLLHPLRRRHKVRLAPCDYRGELLEERRLLAGQPNVALQFPAQVMLGESFALTATFDNTHPTDPGYGPFIDLYVPVNGSDGVGGVGADGLTFGSAQYLGSPVTTVVLTFPDSGGGNGTVVHPYAVDSLGNPLSITGRAGDQLVVMQLPFGSFTASQPPAPITIDMQLSDLADLGQVLNLRSRAGFQFGNTPLNDPASDPSLLSDAAPTASSWTTTAAITPTLIALQKVYLGPEDETATGPNFPRQYRLDIDVADQQTITNLDVTDLLPNNVQLVSVDTISPAGSVTTNPTTPANAPNNRLIVTLPSVTGTTAQNDASVTFTYFVPFRDADSQLTNNSVTGDDATSNNHASALGDWTPTDLRDSGGTDNASVDVAGPEHVLTPKSLAVQKSVAIVADPNVNGLSAGDTLEYRIEFQVSDFFAFQNLVLDDILSDGQRFDTTFAPTLSITEHGLTSSGNMNSANYSVIDHYTGSASPVAPLDGTQTLLFRASDELALRTGDGLLWGGLIPAGGTGGGDPSSGAFNGGGTTGVLIFRSVVQEDFSDTFPSLDSSVDEGDTLRNDITITGDLLDYATGFPTGQIESDDSAAEIDVPAGSLTKSIYALNGSTVFPSPLLLAPGDTITYRLVLAIPTSDVENLALSDYLPLPVLAATEISQFDDVIDASIPLAGRAKFGPTDTFRSIYGSTPTLITDPISNAVTFDYGDFDTPNGAPRIIDILFTVTASSEPFADGLFLTNMARRSQDTTNAADFVTDAIVQVELAMPDLRLSKGIVATDNPAAQFTAPVGPVTFTAPGSAGFRGSSSVNSNGLTATPINANAQNLDAGDLVTFAVVVENTGRSRAGAFDIRLQDTLPAGFTTPSGGLNLTITDGTGAALTTIDLGGGLFAAGIEVVDPGTTPGQPDLTDAGALDEYDATDGRNILILTYDLEVTGTVTPNSALTNTATLFHYAGAEGGTDFTTTDLTDPATVQVAAIDVSKTISATDQPSTTGNNVAIGEVLTYTSTLTIPEGIANNVQWVDVPDAGFSVVELVSITPSLALTTSVGTFADVRNAAILASNGDSLTLNFQTLTNSDRDDATAETITIVYRVVTLNSATNNRGTLLNNLATVTWTGGTDTVSAPNATVVEPELNVTKTIVPATGQASDQFTVSISLQHTLASNADAFDLSLSDILPTGLTYVGGLTSSGTAPTSLTQAGNTISATWNTLPLSSTSTIEFTVQLDGSVQPGQLITNSANSTWTSLPTSVLTPISSDPISTERTGATGNPGGSVNDYADVGSASVTVATPLFTKSVIATNQPSSAGNNVVIGEIVTYRATIAIPQSTLSSVQFIDTPAAGLAIVDVQTVTASSGISSTLGTMSTIAANATLPADGSTLTLNFGTLTNSDADSNTIETITIEYRAIVLNTGTNDRGDVLDNSASFLWGTSNSLTTTGDDLTIIEPAIQISKSLSPTTGQAADTIRVTVNMSHNVASNADTFNVSINDVLPAGMTFLGNLSSTGGLAPSTLTQCNRSKFDVFFGLLA